MQRDPRAGDVRRTSVLSASTGALSLETLRNSGCPGTQCWPGAYLWVPPQPGARSPPRFRDILALRHQDAWLRRAPSSQRSPVKRATPGNWKLPTTKLRHEGYVTFHRGHCGCQEEQQQAIQGHRRPAAPRPSPSRDAPRPGAPLRSGRVASPCPFSLWLGPDSPERGVGVGGSVRAWGGAGARGCGCACVCVCLWERWVCACVCERG